MSRPTAAAPAPSLAAAAPQAAGNNLDHLAQELAGAIASWNAATRILSPNETLRIARRLERLRRKARSADLDSAQAEILCRRLTAAVPRDRAPEDIRGLLLCLDLEVERMRKPLRYAPAGALALAGTILVLIARTGIASGIV
jgi:hypothetical protein